MSRVFLHGEKREPRENIRPQADVGNWGWVVTHPNPTGLRLEPILQLEPRNPSELARLEPSRLQSRPAHLRAAAPGPRKGRITSSSPRLKISTSSPDS
jgi:hypothetical protein